MTTPWPEPEVLTPRQEQQVREDPAYFAMIAPDFIIRCLLKTLDAEREEVES